MNHFYNRKTLLWVLIPLVSFLWFWFWRARQWTGGDSEQWEREIHGGVWFRKRQMLSFGVMQGTFQITRRLMGWSSRRAINFASCLAGALAIAACWRHFHDRRAGWRSLLIVGTAGFTTIFYGHIETYAHPVACLLLHLLALRRFLQKRWGLWTVMATFTLTAWFHLAIFFTAPAILILIGMSCRKKELREKEFLRLALASSPLLILWAVFRYTDWGVGELVGARFIVPLTELARRPWVVFTHHHLATKFWFFAWNGGIAGALGLWIFIRALKRKSREPFILYLFPYFLCFMIFTLIWNPDAGLLDFDLFCFPWVIAVLAFAEKAPTLPIRSVWIGLALGFNLALFLTRPVVFSDWGYRGYGAIDVRFKGETETFTALLDQRLKLSERNDFVPAGSHEIRIVPTLKNWRRVINVKKGERYLYEFDGETFQFKGLNQ